MVLIFFHHLKFRDLNYIISPNLQFPEVRGFGSTLSLALLGQDVGTSAVVRYQLQFRLDVKYLALVHTFNF